MQKLNLILFGLILFVSGAAHAATLVEFGEDLDRYATPAYPDIYGTIVDNLPEEEVNALKPALKGVEIFGYLQTMGNMANKIDAGEYTSATVDGILTTAKYAMSSAANETTKKVLLYGVGVSTLPLTALFVTIDIARASQAAVEESRTALALEALYGRIEANRALKTPGRKLGEGDPIRQDPAAVELLWRLVYTDKEFEAIFKEYVTTELKQDWPEPTMWEQLTTSSDVLREAKLLEEQKIIKSYIKSLIGELNKVAKKREAAVLLSQQLREISSIGGKMSPEELQKAIEYYHYALLKLPEIQQYLTAFPGKATNLKTRYDLADPAELEKIRKEIIEELVNIRLYAAAVRGFPTKGKYGNTRATTLNQLKQAQAALDALYGAIPQSEINKRLEEKNKKILAEAAKLDTGGVAFEFTRHEYTKRFDNLKEHFYNKVVSGAADAGEAVSQAKAEAKKHSDEINQDYSDDFAVNRKKYNEANQKINEQIAIVGKAHAEAKEYSKQKAELYAQLEKLKQQARDLLKSFENYQQIFNATKNIDQSEYEITLIEIDSFVEKNQNRLGIAWSSLVAQADTANTLYAQFHQHHISGVSGAPFFLGADSLERIKKIVNQNPTGYLGVNLAFLQDEIRFEGYKSRTRSLADALQGIVKALKKYMSATVALEMEYYTHYETRELPSLKLMASPQASEAVQRVSEALDLALAAFKQVDLQNIPLTEKTHFTETLALLKSDRAEMAGYQQALSLAASLAQPFEKYLSRAQAQNISLADDMQYLDSVFKRFNETSQDLERAVAALILNSANWSFKSGRPPPIIASDTVKNILDKQNILELSEKLGLKLDRFVAGDFFDVKAKEGVITISVEDINSLAAKIQSLPTTNLQAFYQPFHALKQSGGPPGFLMEGYTSLGNHLWPLFDCSPAIAAAGQRLKETIAGQVAKTEQNQLEASNLNVRFKLILDQVSPALDAIKQLLAQGKYDSALFYVPLRDDLNSEYTAIGQKRADVDTALGELAGLIAQAQEKIVSAGAPGSGAEASEEEITAIKDLYAGFAQAYESRDSAWLMSNLGDSWQAGDGTTLTDLERNFGRSFKTFDEIKYNLQNLQINKIAAGKFLATYDVAITSKIYSRGLQHEEKSSVREEVTLDSAGKPKITRTLSGNFWFSE